MCERQKCFVTPGNAWEWKDWQHVWLSYACLTYIGYIGSQMWTKWTCSLLYTYNENGFFSSVFEFLCGQYVVTFGLQSLQDGSTCQNHTSHWARLWLGKRQRAPWHRGVQSELMTVVVFNELGLNYSNYSNTAQSEHTFLKNVTPKKYCKIQKVTRATTLVDIFEYSKCSHELRNFFF